MSKWPNLFIVGAPRAGTHSLYELLKQHSSVYMSPRKEPYYFCREIIKDDDKFCNPIRNEKEYLKLFEGVKNEKVLGEATVSYLADPLAAKRIFKKSPNAKILISLRNPADRAFSQFLGLKNHRIINSSFSDAIREDLEKIKKNEFSLSFLNPGFYYKQIIKYFEIFDSEQIKIIILDDFIENPIQILNDINRFLGLEEFEYKIEKYGEYNPPRRKMVSSILGNKIIIKIGKQIMNEKSRKKVFQDLAIKDKQKPVMSNEERSTLNEIYRSDTSNL